MGSQNSKSEVSFDHLDTEEIDELKIKFSKICTNDSAVCSRTEFENFCKPWLDPWLAGRISSILSSESTNSKSGKKDERIILQDSFVKFISSSIKGDLDEKTIVIARICNDSHSNENVNARDLMQFAESLINSYFLCIDQSPKAKSWAGGVQQTTDTSMKASVAYILRDLFYPYGIPPKDLLTKPESQILPEKVFTLDEMIAGVARSVLLQKLFTHTLSFTFDFNKPKALLIPHCLKVCSALTPREFSILDFNSIMFLNSQLPVELRDEWRFLFSTTTHGESYTNFYKRIQGKGSTVIILKDDDGRVFGGFATDSWELGPKFFGDSRAFLFHLNPIFETYTATNYNTNFQYFNIDQKTLPNGLGIGGTLEYFGLWIDSEFGIGKTSPSCTTFNCPQLSQQQDFKIVHLEVWGVGPEPEKEEGIRDKRSVLDQDPEAKAVLEIMGRGASASDGYRDMDPAEEDFNPDLTA